MNVTLCNRGHPEYGAATIPLPIPDEEYAHCIGRVNGEKLRLLGIKAELETAQQGSAAFDHRMEEIDAALVLDSGMIEEYDDIRTRQLISNIKVLDKDRLLIRFRDGAESVQTV